MRFLILTQYYPPEIGAAQARLSAFAKQLQHAGHEVEVVTALPNYPSGAFAPSDRRRLARHEVIDGIHVRRVWMYPATGAGGRRLLSYLSFTVTGLLRSLGARRPDVVFVESPPLFLAATGWIVARRFGARVVMNVSDLWPDSARDLGLIGEGLRLRLAERLERWLYRRVDAVTAVTEGIRTRLVEAKGVPRERVLFLPNGADLDSQTAPADVPELRARLGLPTRPFVLYAGNHGFAHSLETLVLAAELVPDVDVVLVGDGSEKPRIEALVAERGLRNVRFLPPVPQSEVPALYALAMAGVSTIRDAAVMEGARPAKALATMAAGRPILYAGRGEGADLVRSAEAGIAVPPEDPEALGAAIRALAADPAEAARLGANGRRYIEQNLSWPALTAAWLRELATVLEWDLSTVDRPHHAP
jgi:colanic acid biosynthesis glycosyl transferase WcaI